MSKLYKVLWIDDDHDTWGADLKGEAFDNGIQLVGFASVEEGFEHLRQYLPTFDAVLLDAMAFELKGQKPGTESERSLDLAREKLASLERVLPWLVLTGQPDLHGSASFNHRYERYYRKGEDEEIKRLFTDIKNKIEAQPEHQLRARYADAFAACTNQVVSEVACRLLVKVLQVVETPQSNHDDDSQFNNLRKIVEEIFIAALRHQLLPSECIPRGKVNIANCVTFFSGEPTKVSDIQRALPRARLLPRALVQAVHAYTNLTSSGSHSAGLDNPNNLVELRQRVRTPYLLAALTYQILDLLVWFKSVVEDPLALRTYQNAWIIDPPLTYVSGVVTHINAARTAGTFIAHNGSSALIYKSTLSDSSLNLREGTVIEAVLGPLNSPRPSGPTDAVTVARLITS